MRRMSEICKHGFGAMRRCAGSCRFREKFDAILQISWISSGAKERKPCRSRKMLKNAPPLAIRGVDTDENEPSKVSMKWGCQTGVACVILRRGPLCRYMTRATPARGPHFIETLEGSFSAASTSMITRVGAFFSINILRDLQDVHSFAPLHTQKVIKHSF